MSKIANERQEEFLAILSAANKEFSSDSEGYAWFAKETGVSPAFVAFTLSGKFNYGLGKTFPMLVALYKAIKRPLENALVWVHPKKVDTARELIGGGSKSVGTDSPGAKTKGRRGRPKGTKNSTPEPSPRYATAPRSDASTEVTLPVQVQLLVSVLGAQVSAQIVETAIEGGELLLRAKLG